MMKNKYKVIWIVLLFGIIFLVLACFGYLWYLKQYPTLQSQSFDETEFLKTHYRGVDCSSLSGTIQYDDYGISAQEVCIAERAWYENNVELCKFYDRSYICVEWLAAKTGDLKICELNNQIGVYPDPPKIREEGWKNGWLYKCYEFVAVVRDDPAICDLIPYTSETYKQKCKDDAKDGNTYLNVKGHPFR